MITTFSHGAVRRTAVRVVTASAATTLAIGLAACSSRGSDEPTGAPEATVTTIAIVAPENESDFGWNQVGLTGAGAAADELGLELISIPDAGWDNTETVLSQVAEDGAQFIIAHASGYGVAAQTVSAQDGVAILAQDAGLTAVPGQLASALVAAEQGGYLAGVVAAMSTTSNKVGIVVSADDTNWFKMSAGFADGVYSIDPSIEILYTSVGPAAYADSAGGKSATESLIAGGADVIFGMGDGATLGFIQAVEAADGVKYIADIGDVTPGLSDPSILLTSVLWDYTPTYLEAIADVVAGDFGTHDYTLTVDNGGLLLQETDNLTPAILAAVEAAKAGISDGSIVPTSAASAEEVAAAIAAK